MASAMLVVGSVRALLRLVIGCPCSIKEFPRASIRRLKSSASVGPPGAETSGSGV